MKTIADLKRKLTPGREITLINSAQVHPALNIRRQVVSAQTNGVWLSWMNEKQSFLDFPKRAEFFPINEHTFRVAGAGFDNTYELGASVIDNPVPVRMRYPTGEARRRQYVIANLIKLPVGDRNVWFAIHNDPSPGSKDKILSHYASGRRFGVITNVTPEALLKETIKLVGVEKLLSGIDRALILNGGLEDGNA